MLIHPVCSHTDGHLVVLRWDVGWDRWEVRTSHKEEQVMKQVVTLIVLTGILLGGSVFVLRVVSLSRVQAQDSCTTASFQGAFGYTFTGITGVDALAFAA